MDLDKARVICDELMDLVSNVRIETGQEAPMTFGFYLDGKLGLVPAVVLDPECDKDILAAKVRLLADHMGAEAVFTVSECWVSLNPFAEAPSKDPAREEALMVVASAAGVSLMLTRPINGDGSLGEVKAHEGITGRFSNLSDREMMN